MIIDQYRASVRILYEKFLAQTADRTMVPQSVLFPEAVHFSPSETAILQTLLPLLATMGFELSDLGGGSYAVNAIPAGLEGVNAVVLIQNIVSTAAEQTSSVSNEIHHSLALSLARSAAIPYGQVLGNEEMENLVNQLFACENVNYTPDGKPTLAILAQNEIERLLG
jgi:DNA mismatch repair protein MutL